MSHEVQFKPFDKNPDFKYKRIEITDVTFHTAHRRPTESIFAKFLKAFKVNKAGRAYQPYDQKAFYNPRGYVLEMIKRDPDILKYIQDEEKNGYKVLIQLPRDGIPKLVGEDTLEFIESKNGKRLLRKLVNKNDDDKISG